MSLKIKLALSYIFLSLFLVSALLITSNYYLEEQFRSYIMESQEKKNLAIVEQVSGILDQNGTILNDEILLSIGNTALNEGMVLMVSDLSGLELFCMSTIDSMMCDNMLESMQNHMESIYPGFAGEYEQKNYDVIKNNDRVAIVTLGYYGPYYYNDADIHFLEVLNRVFITVAAIFLLLAVVFGYVMAEKISWPIRRVIDKTKEIEDGNYQDRLDGKTNTKEIDQLLHSVNSLADTLQKQQMMKKRLAADYAHELRTPLTTIQSNLEAMIDGIWEPTSDRLESCREEVQRLTRMIANIENIDRMESDNLRLTKEKFDLSETTSQIIMNFHADFESKDIRIKFEKDEKLVHADKDKIKQVIVNLISNAIKYTHSGGEILIQISEDGSGTRFMIRDNGIGIEAEDIPNIFEHLYRADRSRTRSTGGSGIGLSVVKAIIEAHNGEVSVESRPGAGSTFEFFIPS